MRHQIDGFMHNEDATDLVTVVGKNLIELCAVWTLLGNECPRRGPHRIRRV